MTTTTTSLYRSETTGRWTIGTTTTKLYLTDGRKQKVERSWEIGGCVLVVRTGRTVETFGRLLRDGMWTEWERESEERYDSVTEAREAAREAREAARKVAREYLIEKAGEGERWAA